MRQADRVLEDETLLATVQEALQKRHPRRRTHGRPGTRRRWCCACYGSSISATGFLRSWNEKYVLTWCIGGTLAQGREGARCQDSGTSGTRPRSPRDASYAIAVAARAN